MFHVRRIVVLSAVSLLTAIVAIGWQSSSEVLAHGVIDQQHETSNGASQIDAFEPVGQEFTPTMASIVAAEVRLESFNQQGAASITLRVRSLTIAGTILASATQSVPQDLPGGEAWIHFELPSAVNLTPGQTYVIELESTNASHGWQRQNPGSYAGGSGIFSGAISALDWRFRTYGGESVSIKGDVDCSGAVNSIDALKLLRYAAGLSVGQVEPCIDIGRPS